MKKQVVMIFAMALLGAMLWSCSKSTDTDLYSTSVKETINESAQTLNSAMADITASSAYSILTVSDVAVKSSTGTIEKSSIATDSIYSVYISLDNIKGVYDYNPVETVDRWGYPLINYFSMVEDDSRMIVNMPLEKVLNPATLRHYLSSDSSLSNNFSIAVSDYHNNYNNYWDYDYLLNSEISIDGLVAGNLDINSFVSPTLGVQYTSQYEFAGGYTAKYTYNSSDTTVSSFAITGSDKVLYKEERITIKNDTALFGREHQYTLTIGDVQIVRKSFTAAPEVYVSGVLQSNAVVAIIDSETDTEASVCRKRDIQITFEDGTTITVSALIGDSIGDIKTLFESLHSVYFAAYVVDWIAYDIYYQRN